jgi:hypothetical protein
MSNNLLSNKLNILIKLKIERYHFVVDLLTERKYLINYFLQQQLISYHQLFNIQ